MGRFVFVVGVGALFSLSCQLGVDPTDLRRRLWARKEEVQKKNKQMRTLSSRRNKRRKRKLWRLLQPRWVVRRNRPHRSAQLNPDVPIFNQALRISISLGRSTVRY